MATPFAVPGELIGRTLPSPHQRLLFNVLAMVAQFESDLIRRRTHEGMRRAEGSSRCPAPLSNGQPRYGCVAAAAAG